MGGVKEWSSEDLALLRNLWGGQLSSGQIGRLLGRSRDSVSGKAHKLGLPTKKHPDGIHVQGLRKRRNAAPPPDRDLKQVPELESLNRLLADLEMHECRWVTAGVGAEALFCALAADEPYGYCKTHHKLAYEDRRPVQRAPFLPYRAAADGKIRSVTF